MRKTFEIYEPVSVDARVSAGELRVDAVDTTEVEVEVEALDEAAEGLLDAVRVELRGRDLQVEVPERRGFFTRGPRFAIRMRVPRGSRLSARSRSAEIESRGELETAEVKTASGDVELEHVDGEVRVQSASGDVTVEYAGGVTLTSASGDIIIGHCRGHLRANLVSGDLTVRAADGRVDAHTVSGDQRLDAVGPGPVSANSVSGDIALGVRRGVTVWLDVRSISGDTFSELEAGEGPPDAGADVMELRVNTVSGDVRIERASTAVS